MTSILQPLDICTNRSFQQFYDDKYESHLELALSKPSTDMTYYTSQGNIKIPTYNQITNWCVDFLNNFDADLIKKAFEVCGIGCLDRERYHHKLKDLLENNLCLEDILNPQDGYDDDGRDFYFDFERNVLCVSLFDALSRYAHFDAHQVLQYVVTELRSNERVNDIVDEEYLSQLSLDGSENFYDIGQSDFFAFCCVFECNILLFNAIDREILRFGNFDNGNTYEMACNDVC